MEKAALREPHESKPSFLDLVFKEDQIMLFP